MSFLPKCEDKNNTNSKGDKERNPLRVNDTAVWPLS